MSSANVIEIFSSVQGEGKFLGCRQIFVRLADCNLDCAYCDTDFRRAEFCRVETAAGSMTFRDVKNPLDAAQVAEIIKNFSEDVPTQAVSFTGGEPLLHWQFVREVASLVKNFGVKIFLETNGTLPDELAKISDAVDIVSMDIKLGQNLFDVHEKFLRVAQGKDLCVKIVVTGETTREEFSAAIDFADYPTRDARQRRERNLGEKNFVAASRRSSPNRKRPRHSSNAQIHQLAVTIQTR